MTQFGQTINNVHRLSKRRQNEIKLMEYANDSDILGQFVIIYVRYDCWKALATFGRFNRPENLCKNLINILSA